MFDFLRSKRSLVRRELKVVPWVRQTWFEWSIENGRRESVLVVEMSLDLDPNRPDFAMHRIDAVTAVVTRCAAAEKGPDRVRIIPHVSAS